MLRSYRTRFFSVVPVLGLAAFSTLAGRAGAQTYDAVIVPHDHHTEQGWCFFGRRPPIPRTFSYQYQPWFNQPCHTRITRPDGSRFWQTTVRGLPLGTPWPSY
jgi:hypothetical protein